MRGCVGGCRRCVPSAGVGAGRSVPRLASAGPCRAEGPLGRGVGAGGLSAGEARGGVNPRARLEPRRGRRRRPWAGQDCFSIMVWHESVWYCLRRIGWPGRWGLPPTRNPGSDSVLGRGGPPFVETDLEGSRPQRLAGIVPAYVTDLEGCGPQKLRWDCAYNVTAWEGSRPQRLDWINPYIVTDREGLRPQTAWMRSCAPLYM